MAFWVYGRDAQSGETTDPFFTEAASAEAARVEASAQGMIVESVEAHVSSVEPAGARVSPPDPGAAPNRPSEPQYEFTPGQNQEIAWLAWYMWIVGGALILYGLLQVAVGLSVPPQGNAFAILQGMLGLLLGGLTVYAATAFHQIVNTRGRDIDHLMDALSRLKFIYAIQVWVLGLALLAFVFLLAMSLSR